MGTAVLTDSEVERLEQARTEGREAEVQAEIDAEREKLAETERMEAEFDAAAPTRDDIDAAHAEQSAESGEASDVPGVGPAAGIDPELLDEEDSGQMAVPVADEGRFTLNAGGKKPTSASLTLQGGKIEWPDELKKGRKVRVTFTCRVGGVHFDDKVDSKTGQIVASERKQILKPVAPAEVELL